VKHPATVYPVLQVMNQMKITQDVEYVEQESIHQMEQHVGNVYRVPSQRIQEQLNANPAL